MSDRASPAASPTGADASRGRPALPTDAGSLPALGPGFSSILEAGLVALDLRLTEAGRRALDAQARLLLAWTQHINLTAIRTPEAVARLHVIDSLTAVPFVRDRVPSRPSVLDLGTGGGYPGMPVAIALRATRLTLVDSVAKKARFLDVVASAARACLDDTPDRMLIETLGTRAEAVAVGVGRATWDVVTVRAVGPLAEVAELGLPLLREGGLLVCWKRRAPTRSQGTTAVSVLDEEVLLARALVTELGGDVPVEVPTDVPGSAGHCLVLVRKVGRTPERFPRPPAERRRRLLG